MRIISKVKDYYDGVQQMGIDKSITYVRDTKEIINPEIKFNMPVVNIKENNRYSHVYYSIIGVCGKLYPFVKYLYNEYPSDRGKESIFYNKDFWNYKYYRKDWYRFDKKTDEELYNEMINNLELKSIFVKYKVPVFLLEYKYGEVEIVKNHRNRLVLTLNPILKDFYFQTNLDSFSIFQEIQMFLSNQLVDTISLKVPVGNDEVIGNSKGFDRYSFRNTNENSNKPKKF